MSNILPTKEQNPAGLHQRYRVEKLYGETDPRAEYFVLRIDPYGDDPVWIDGCRSALRCLAGHLNAAGHMPELADGILEHLRETEDDGT